MCATKAVTNKLPAKHNQGTPVGRAASLNQSDTFQIILFLNPNCLQNHWLANRSGQKQKCWCLRVWWPFAAWVGCAICSQYSQTYSKWTHIPGTQPSTGHSRTTKAQVWQEMIPSQGSVFSRPSTRVSNGTVTLGLQFSVPRAAFASPPTLALGWSFLWISQLTHREFADSPCCRPASFPALLRSRTHLLTNSCSTIQPSNNRYEVLKCKTCTRCIMLSSSATQSDFGNAYS